MGTQSIYILSAFALVVTLFLLRFLRQRSRRSCFPPGPRALPVIGNILDMPSPTTLHPWKLYNTWFHTYGDLVHVRLFQQHVVLLGSFKIVQEIFEKHGSQFSERPANVMISLMGWDFNFATLNYTPWYRRHRKTFHEFFNASAVQNYQHIQYREVQALLTRLAESPDRFLHHVRHTLSAIIMDVAYGIRIRDTDDPYIKVAEEAVSFLNRAGIAGSFIVDFFPFMKDLPPWVPGTSFQQTAAYAKTIVTNMIEKPYEFVKRTTDEGNSGVSVAEILYSRLPEGKEREDQETVLKNVSGVAYAAGADTTSSAVQSFFLAMVMFPDAQRKAQTELDRVVGRGRLPRFEDRKHLPYIQALVNEVMRWQPVSPLGVPHSTNSDFIYNGYLIPAGTMLLGSVWAILHDPEMYPNPERFNPDRFLKDGQLNPSIRAPDVAFGFGRRVCPGRYLSDNNVYLIVTSVLATFDILPVLEENGVPISYRVESTNGLFTYPRPFKCTIQRRF